MKLSNGEHAVVEQAKIVDYLLNAAHPDNGGKAAFFLSHGFRQDDWDTLAAALRRLAISVEVEKSVESPHGHKYIATGPLEAPSGKSPSVRTVWIVDAGEDAPRLVTAYPRDE